MTTKELINQYVTAHAGNRRMGASELGALLTEFAEKLKEPASEDFQESLSEDLREVVCNELLKYSGEKYWKAPWVLDSTGVAHPLHFAKLGAQWQREQMMKNAIEGYIEGDQRNQEDEPYDVYAVSGSLDTTKFKIGDKVKVIIIKE